MITTVTGFKDAVAFETYVIDKMFPVISDGENDSIDLRGDSRISTVRVSFSENISAGAVEQLKNDLAPLIFGAAWKVLDLALELILSAGGHKPDRGAKSEWSISAKQSLAAKGAGDFNTLTSDRQVWVAIGALYANTIEHRHSLVHRTAVIDSSSGALGGKDREGNALASLSRDQQRSIAHIALLVAEGIVGGGIVPRNRDHLCYYLDQVASHTSQTLFGVTSAATPPEILTEIKIIDEQLVVDVQAAAEKAAKVFQGVRHFNVVFDIPDGTGRRLKANLEEIPSGRTVIDLDALPHWLSFF